jgi:hypothetical protein
MRVRTTNTWEDEDVPMPASLRAMQIVAAALVVGVIAFLAIVLYLVLAQKQGGANPPPNLPLISLIAAGSLVVATVVSFALPAAIVRSTLRRIAAGTWKPEPGMAAQATDSDKLLALYQTTLIVGLALLEGACFFSCIAYLVEGQPFVLAVVAVGVGLMLVRFPTEGRVRRWLEDHKEQLARARQEVGPGSHLGPTE